MGHIDPCLAQLAILSNVDSTYSALFLGVSKLSWLLPCEAISIPVVALEGLGSDGIGVRGCAWCPRGEAEAGVVVWIARAPCIPIVDGLAITRE